MGQKLGGRNRAKPDARAEPEKEWGRGMGRKGALDEPLPRKCLEFRTSNRSNCCIVETKILKFSTTYSMKT